MNNYYVYIYWRLDINEPFYIGMGHGNRWKELNRKNNPHFMNIIKKVPIVVEIVKDNLTQREALDIECWLINELVFEYGFSIDIPRNRSNNTFCNLVNMTWGGEGSSGMNPYENKTEEEMKRISKMKSDSKMGKKNPMWGKSPRDFMTEEDWNKKIEKVSGGNNYRAKSVICITTKMIFKSITKASEYYGIRGTSHLCQCCRKERKSCGKHKGQKLIWRYLVWNHGKTYRISNK